MACATSLDPWVEALRSDAAAGGPVSEQAAVVLIWADSKQDSWKQIVRARTESPLQESRLLARSFEAASVSELEVVTGGPQPALNEQVVIDAFSITPRERLPGLQLIYVSPGSPSERLIEVFELRGVRWSHRPWLGELP